MTPQSAFMVVAPIEPSREAALRSLLASMNAAPGRVNPANLLVPFAQFDALHVARFLIIDDKTLGDVQVYGLTTPEYPRSLAFLGDVDGDSNEFLADAASRADSGLRAIFSHCQDFTDATDLLAWMKAHSISAAANYVNRRGRTVRRVREDAALREALERYLDEPEARDSVRPRELHRLLRQRAYDDVSKGRLTLSVEAPTPLAWTIRNAIHLVALPLVVLAIVAAIVVSAIAFLLPTVAALVVIAGGAVIYLRRLEKTDAELCSQVDDGHSNDLASIEDDDVTNQFSAMGSLKPGAFRLLITSLVLVVIDYAARHIYTRGRLARVRTIHFARWVFLDRKRRVIFLSNYDGSLESYMDDFINKVGFGLNVVFSNGIGYPRTSWLLKDGCADERKFKEYLRRHQMPTQVWYKAYPSLTAVDLERNARLRSGLESPSLSEREAQEWVSLLCEARSISATSKVWSASATG